MAGGVSQRSARRAATKSAAVKVSGDFETPAGVRARRREVVQEGGFQLARVCVSVCVGCAHAPG